jgi:hypothetical protein
MINPIKACVDKVSFREVCGSLQSILAMDPLRKKVDLVGRTIAQRSIQLFNRTSEQQEENPFGISSIPHFHSTQFNTSDTFAATAGICSQILFYGAFYAGVCATVGPVDSWSSTAVLLGPWWSSSYWMDWLLYDFFRSAIDLEDFNLKSIDHFLNRWIPHNHHEHLRDAFKYRKLCLTLCAIIVCATYLYVCAQRPPANQVIMSRASNFLTSLRGIESSVSFQDLLHSWDK